MRIIGLVATSLILTAPPHGLAADTSGNVAVRVVDTTGTPIADALVACATLPDVSRERTDARGEALIPLACPQVTCSKPGFMPGESAVDLGRATCVLQPAVFLQGVLAGAPCGEGCVASARRRTSESPLASGPVSTKRAFEHEGAFELGPLPEADLVVRVARAGWACEAELGPTIAGTHRIVVPWREPSEIGVRVLNADGRGAEGVPVQVRQERAADPRSINPVRRALGQWRCRPTAPLRTLTEREGKATLLVDPQEPVLVIAGSWEDERGVDAALVSPEDERVARLALARGARVIARLVRPGGTPASCRAALSTEDPLDAWLTSALGGALVATCNREGRLELGPLRASRVTLEVQPERALPVRIADRLAGPGQTLDLGDIVLETGLALVVRVTNEDGVPIEGATVFARGRAGLILDDEATTDAAGMAQVGGLPPGASVEITASAPGYRAVTRTEVQQGEGPIEIALGPGAIVRGMVTDTAGDPVAGAQILPSNETGTLDRAVTDESGAFALESLAPGVVQMRASASGFAPATSEPIELAAGDTIDGVRLALQPMPRLRGVVRDPDGKPVAGARVRVLPLFALEWGGSTMDEGAAITDTAGRFDVPRSAEQDSGLLATAPGFAPALDRAPNASRGEIDLRLGHPAAVLARLPSNVREDAVVRVVDGQGVGHVARAQGERTVRLEGLAPGVGRASLAGGPARAIRLDENATTDVALSLGSRLDVTVVDTRGAPLPRATVSAATGDGAAFRIATYGLSDESGRVTLSGLPAGTFLVTAETEIGRTERSLSVGEDENLPLTLEVATIEVQAFVTSDTDGPPIPGALVQLLAADFAKSGQRPRSTGFRAFPKGQTGFDLFVRNFSGDAEYTGSDGRATLRVPAEGVYQIRVAAEGHESVSRVVELVSGTQVAVVALEPEANVGSIAIEMVTDPPGLFGSLRCTDSQGGSDADFVAGRGLCEDLAPGPVDVIFHVAGVGAARRTVDVEARRRAEVSLTVPRGGTLVVPVASADGTRPSITDASGFDWTRAFERISIASSESIRLEVRPDVGSAWVFYGVPPGEYTARIGGASRGPVRVASGAVVVLR